MSQLFAALYLDEDVHVLVADLVRNYGFSATTTLDENRLGRTDGEQLAYAAQQDRALLTHNRVDFERLATEYFEAGRTHAGIVIAVRRSPYEIARRVTRILKRRDRRRTNEPRAIYLTA